MHQFFSLHDDTLELILAGNFFSSLMPFANTISYDTFLQSFTQYCFVYVQNKVGQMHQKKCHVKNPASDRQKALGLIIWYIPGGLFSQREKRKKQPHQYQLQFLFGMGTHVPNIREVLIALRIPCFNFFVGYQCKFGLFPPDIWCGCIYTK